MAIPSLVFAPMTELDAVNAMLMSIGQAPVNTLAVAGLKDVSFAQLMLHNANRDIQTKGWYFNTDEEYPLTPDVNGKLALDPTWMSVDPCDKSQHFVERYDDNVRRLWDRDNHTFVIGKTIKVDVTWFFPFEKVPQAARSYIAHHAARVWQASQVGSELLHKFTQERELELLAELQREELRTSDTNAFTRNSQVGRIAFANRNTRW